MSSRSVLSRKKKTKAKPRIPKAKRKSKYQKKSGTPRKPVTARSSESASDSEEEDSRDAHQQKVAAAAASAVKTLNRKKGKRKFQKSQNRRKQQQQLESDSDTDSNEGDSKYFTRKQKQKSKQSPKQTRSSDADNISDDDDAPTPKPSKPAGRRNSRGGKKRAGFRLPIRPRPALKNIPKAVMADSFDTSSEDSAEADPSPSTKRAGNGGVSKIQAKIADLRVEMMEAVKEDDMDAVADTLKRRLKLDAALKSAQKSAQQAAEKATVALIEELRDEFKALGSLREDMNAAATRMDFLAAHNLKEEIERKNNRLVKRVDDAIARTKISKYLRQLEAMKEMN